MKRLFCVILLVCMVLSGCQAMGDRMKEPVTFYYIRTDYQQDLSEVFASEQREASGHLDDLSYLMALYLMGPVDESLKSPIPRGTRIYVETNNAYNVKLNLSETAESMTDAEFSIASACLSMTCLRITGTQEVTVTCGSRSVTMTAENLELFDSSMIFTTEEPQ